MQHRPPKVYRSAAERRWLPSLAPLALGVVALVGLSGCGPPQPQARAPYRGRLPNPAYRSPKPIPPLFPSHQQLSYESQVLWEVNAQRARGARCGDALFAPQPPLLSHPQLIASARSHSWDMAMTRYMSHRSRDGRTMANRIQASGYRGRALGENIARGQQTPGEVVTTWMQSDGHCRNIMDPTFRFVGVGYAYNSNDSFRHYWAQNFGG